MNSLARAGLWIRFPLFLFAALYWILADKKYLPYVFGPLLGLLIFIIIDTTVQFFTGTSLTGHPAIQTTPVTIRLTGPFNNVKVGIFTAKMFLPVVGWLLWSACERGSKRYMLGAIALLLATIAMILLTGERGALLLSVMAVGLSAVLVIVYNPKWRVPVLGLGSVLGALLLAIIATQPMIQERLQFMIEQMSNVSDNVYGRAWRIAFHLWLENPLHGVGLANYKTACLEFIKTSTIAFNCEDHTHNVYLEWLSDAGLVGFALFLWFVGSLFWQPIKQLRSAAFIANNIWLITAAIGTLAINLFPFISSSSTFSNWPGVLYWCSLTLSLALLNLMRKEGVHG